MAKTKKMELIQLTEIQKQGNGIKKNINPFYKFKNFYDFLERVEKPQLDVFCYDSSLLEGSKDTESNARKITYSTFSKKQGWEERYETSLKKQEKFNQFWNWKPNIKGLFRKITYTGGFAALTSLIGASPWILIPAYLGAEGIQSKKDKLENGFSVNFLEERMQYLKNLKNNLERAEIQIYQPEEAKKYVEKLGKFVKENPFARLEGNEHINNQLMEIYGKSH